VNAPPRRTDLNSRPKRLAATLMARGLGLVERLLASLLVEVTPPADDPFYRQPENPEAFSPGEVLDARAVEVRMLRRRLKADAWQVKFRSTDTQGAAVSGVTTVMIPRRPFNEPVRPLLSYQAAIDSLGPAANPSFTLRRGNQKELPLIQRALRRGWAVATTDFTGPRHAHAAGPVAGRFVLDGIRAALAFEPANFDAATPIGLGGYSGGGHATAFAAEEQRSYAPELNIVGAAAGAVPVDERSWRRMCDDDYYFSGLALASCIGISREFPDFDLQSVLTPQGEALVDAAAEMTTEQLLASFPFLRWGDYLTVPSFLDAPGMGAVANGLGQATPMTTMYLYHAVHDQFPVIEDVDELVEKYRHEGVDVTYRRFRFGEHMIVALTGVPSALRFLSERFSTRS
jgi:hypothetical protein